MLLFSGIMFSLMELCTALPFSSAQIAYSTAVRAPWRDFPL
jgi:hypothetical protein